MKNTICAISTPIGKGAVSIVRLSGKESLEIMEKVFSSKSLSYDKINPRYMYLSGFVLCSLTSENLVTLPSPI